MHTIRDYTSFLVRLWSEPGPDDEAPDTGWQAEVESIQTGDRWRFSEFRQLAAFFEDVLPKDEHNRLHTDD